MKLRFENRAEGQEAEKRTANLLYALNSENTSVVEAVGAARWFAHNWMKARRGIAEAAKLTADPDVQRALAEALEVEDEIVSDAEICR